MKYSLTLSRWHKVAERMNAALSERETNVKAALTATTISPWNKQGVEEKAAEIVQRAADDLALFDVGARAVAAIRAALAVRNVELGISTKLAEAEAAKRRGSLYKAVIEGQRADMVRPDGVQSLPDLAGDAEPYAFSRRSAATVTLQTADRALIASLREKLEGERLRATRLLDEVADLNREKLELEMPEEVLTIAGLAA